MPGSRFSFFRYKFHKHQFLLILIMLTAAFVRFYHYADWSLSNDELSALNRLRFDSFSEMITQGVKLGDFHPAGVQVMLWFWLKTFGDSVWIVRLPFVIFGILSVGLVYLIGKRWFGTTTALFAAAAMAFLQYPVLYSQLARPYAPGLFFSLAFVWFWTKVVFDSRRSFLHYACFALSAALAAYSHNYSFLFVIVVGISGFFFYRKLELKKYLLAALSAAILYLPHIPIFFYQFGIGGVGGEGGWLGKPEPDWIWHYLFFAFNQNWIVIAVGSLIFIFSVLKFSHRFTKFHLLAISWFVIMFLIGYFYSLLRNPILQYSILIFSFPFLLLFLFSFLPSKLDKSLTILLIVGLLSGLSQSLLIAKHYQQLQFGEFEGLAKKTAEWSERYGKSNITNITSISGPYYIHYYLDNYDSTLRFAQYQNNGKEDLRELVEILDTTKTPYFSYAWPYPVHGELELVVHNKYPCILDQVNFGYLSKAVLAASIPGDSCIEQAEPIYVFNRNFDEANQRQWYTGHLDSTQAVSPPYSYQLDSSQAVVSLYKTKASLINEGNYKRVEIEVSAFSQKEIENTVLVLSMEEKHGNTFLRGSPMQYYIIPGKWGKAFLSYTFQQSLPPDAGLNVYFWNPAKDQVLIDNLEVRFY